MEEKKNGNAPEIFCRSVFFLWPPTEMRSFGHNKNTDLLNCFRLSKHCTKASFKDKM